MYSKIKVENSLKNAVSFCPLDNCPYRNGIQMVWEGEDYTICSTNGIVEKSGLMAKMEKKKVA